MENGKYSLKENEDLYFACNTLRAGIQVPNKKYNAIRGRFALISKESAIYKMIVENNWEELFKNEIWIKIIILMHKNDNRNIYSKSFKIISQLFPGILEEPKEVPLEEKPKEKPKRKKKKSIKITIKYLEKKLDTYLKNYLVSFPKGSD